MRGRETVYSPVVGAGEGVAGEQASERAIAMIAAERQPGLTANGMILLPPPPSRTCWCAGGGGGAGACRRARVCARARACRGDTPPPERYAPVSVCVFERVGGGGGDVRSPDRRWSFPVPPPEALPSIVGRPAITSLPRPAPPWIAGRPAEVEDRRHRRDAHTAKDLTGAYRRRRRLPSPPPMPPPRRPKTAPTYVYSQCRSPRNPPLAR